MTRLSVQVCAGLLPVLGILAGTAWAAPPGPPPLSAFFARPAQDHFTVSPGGNYIAASLRGTDGQGEHILVRRNTPGEEADILAVRKLGAWDIQDIVWLNDERLLVAAQPNAAGRYEDRAGRAPGLDLRFRMIRDAAFIAMNADGSDTAMLLNSSFRHRNARYGGILNLLKDDPDHILMAAMPQPGIAPAGDFRIHVYKVNVHTGAGEKIMHGRRPVEGWWADHDGTVRLKASRWNDRHVLAVRLPGQETWTDILQTDGQWPDFTFLDFGSDAGRATIRSRIGLDRKARDRAALFEYDLVSGRRTDLIYRHDSVDVRRPIIQTYTNEIIGAEYVLDRPEQIYFAPAFRAMKIKLDKTFGTMKTSRITSYSRDLRHFIVRVSGPRDPGRFLVFDKAANEARVLGLRMRDLPGQALGDMAPLSYASRDGLEIRGYLTRPPGLRPDETPPLVVMPHDGPDSRDLLAFDPWVQMLASRGYAVFQPNYRGSSGYGWSFERAGDGQHGRAIQNDITDGIRHLIETGKADPGRICILGRGYGGYAALAGAAFTPDLYRCAISVNGLSDLPRHVRRRTRFGGTNLGARRSVDFFTTVFGNPSEDEDKQRMIEVSPRYHAGAIKAPVLLIHDREYPSVATRQSDLMARALKRSGKPHRLVKLQDDKPLRRRRLQVETAREILDFLEEHMPAH